MSAPKVALRSLEAPELTANLSRCRDCTLGGPGPHSLFCAGNPTGLKGTVRRQLRNRSIEIAAVFDASLIFFSFSGFGMVCLGYICCECFLLFLPCASCVRPIPLGTSLLPTSGACVASVEVSRYQVIVAVPGRCVLQRVVGNVHTVVCTCDGSD
jgi:hypothetical protein